VSHPLGTMCREHDAVMLPDGLCPERDCPGGHGYTYEPCSRDCPAHPSNLITLADVEDWLGRTASPEKRAPDGKAED